MAGMSYIIPDNGSEIDFDIVISESVTHAATVTEYPVEKGVNPADHVKPEPVEVSLEVEVTNTPSTPLDAYGGSVVQFQLEMPPMPLQLNPLTAAGDAISDAINGTRPPLVAEVLYFDQPFDKIADTHEALIRLHDQGGTSVVVTSTGNYADMILTSLKYDKTEAGSGKFSLDFKNILVVSSQTVTAPKPVEHRGAKKVSKGSQGTTTPKDSKSVAKTLFDGAKKALGL